MAMMIDSMVNIRDFELMVSDTEMSKAGKGQMNIEIHWALADELITRLREAERDAARYQWLRESASLENHGGFEYDLPLIHAVRYMDGAELNQEMTFDEAIDQAMKEKGDE